MLIPTNAAQPCDTVWVIKTYATGEDWLRVYPMKVVADLELATGPKLGLRLPATAIEVSYLHVLGRYKNPPMY